MAQIRKFQNAGVIEQAPPTYKKINVEGLGEFDPEALRTKFAQDPDSWYNLTGADPKYRTDIINRISEIFDLSKEYGLNVDNAGTYTFANPTANGAGINDKYKSTGLFPRKGIFGVGGRKMDDNAINNLAYFTIGKLIRGDKSIPGSQSNSSSVNNDSYLSDVEARLKLAEQEQESGNSSGIRKGVDSINWEDFVGTGIYSGNIPNLDNFRKAYASDADRFGKVRGLLQSELTKFTDPEWDKNYRWTGSGTREDYTKNLQGLIDSLASNTWGNDTFRAAYNLGAADWLQPFLDSNYVPSTPSTESLSDRQLKPYSLGDNVQFAEGYDANRIYQAARERWPNAIPYYDPQKKLLAFDQISYSTPFNPFLSNYSDIHEGTFYGGYYYGPNEKIPGITDAESEAINATRMNDIFKDDILTADALRGDINYYFDPNIDEIFGGNNPDFGGKSVALIDLSDLFTRADGRTVFRYFNNDQAGVPQNTYGIYDNGKYTYGTLARVPGKGVIFTSNDGTETNLGSVNTSGQHKPFLIERSGKEFNVSYYSAQDPDKTIKNIENGLKANNNNRAFAINNMSEKPFEKAPRAKDIGGKKYYEIRYNNELGGMKVTNPSNRKEILMLSDGVFYWYNPNTNKITEFDRTILKNQKGGIIKAQQGTIFDMNQIEQARQQYTNNRPQEEVVQPTGSGGFTDWNIGGVRASKDTNRDKVWSNNLTIGDLTDSDINLSTSDWLEVGALGADLVSIIAGFVPGANIVGAGVGAAGSISLFGADVTRDGFDLGDLGSLGLNLGMDAVSLIPVAGSALKLGTKGAKILKQVPRLAKLAMIAGLPGAAGTLNKIIAISNDPNRSFNELDGSDIRNLMTFARVGQYAKNKASVKTTKGGQNVQTKNTFEAIRPDGTRVQVELSKEQLAGLNNLKKASEKKSFLTNIINEKAATDASLTDAKPDVSRFSINPWKNAPFKGRVNINSETITTDGSPAWKYNLDDNSAFRRYLAKTREYNTSDIFGRRSFVSNTNPESTSQSSKTTSNYRLNAVELNNQYNLKASQLSDIKKQIRVEQQEMSDGWEKRLNNLAKQSKELTKDLKILRNQGVNQLDRALLTEGDAAKKNSKVSKEGKKLIEDAKKLRDVATKFVTEALNARTKFRGQQTKIRLRQILDQNNLAFFDELRNAAKARLYRTTGNMFGNTFNNGIPNNLGYVVPRRVARNRSQLTLPFNDPLFQGIGTRFKEGGKIVKAQQGTRTATVPRYPRFGVQYDTNYADYDFQPTTDATNLVYGGAETDLTNRADFYRRNLPGYLLNDFVTEQGFNTTGNNVLNFLNNYNNYNNATRDYFLKRGWGNADDINKYASAQAFLTPDQPGTARSTDNKLGNYTSTRSAWMNPMVTPQQLKQLNAANIFTAQHALSNADVARKILGDQLYGDVTLDLTPGSGADYVIGVKENMSPIKPTIPSNSPIPATIPTRTNQPQTDVTTGIGREAGLGKTKNESSGTKRTWDPVPLMRGLEASLGIIGNNKLLAPTRSPKDPLDLYTFVTGDLQQRSMYLNQANKARRWAAKPFTSDASLQSARELDAEMKANDLTAQGWLADANAIRDTGYRAVERQHENARNRNYIANLNKDIFDQNNAARTSLKNQQTLANYGILLNVARDVKNEMILNREAVRNAEIGYNQEQNSLDYAAEQQRLRGQSNDINSRSEKARMAIDLWNQDIRKLDPIKDAELIKNLRDRIAQSEQAIKQNEDWLYGTGNNSYYSSLLNANRNLNTRNMESIRSVASDNRWSPRFGPSGYFGIYQKGGRVPYKEKVDLQNQKDANITNRTLARNLNKKAIEESKDNAKMVREMAKTYRDVLMKFANKPTPRLK